MQTYTLSETSKIIKYSELTGAFVLRDKKRDVGKHFNLMHKGFEHMLSNIKNKDHELSTKEEDRLRYMLEEVISAKKALDKENRKN